MKRSTRLIHKWIGLFSCLFLIIVSVTAIGLNHHDLLSGIFVSHSSSFSSQQIKTMAVDPFNSKHIIVSDLDKSLFGTTDNGKTWNKIELFVPTNKVNNISFDPFQKDKVVVSLKEAGVYLSDDGGDVWDELKLPFFPNEGENIENLSLSKDTIQLKTRFGLYTYDSKGEKWDKQLFDKSGQAKILSLEEMIYNLHTGRIFGNYGIYLYDIISVGLILLSLSGIYLSIKPKRKIRILDKKIVSEATTISE